MRVASNGSMNQTAAELDISISTVSQKIKDIEALLGYPIFERTIKKTRLTPEGVQLLAAAKNPHRLLNIQFDFEILFSSVRRI